MEQLYTPEKIEKKWYQFWEDNELFKATNNDKALNYCIVIPPPNITGSLHMGHAFQDTLMDLLIRYHRMRGYNTLWQPGTDHAGIATQMVVERQINAKGKTRHDLGREDFIEKIWQWKEESGGTITQQLRRMGASPDWTRERFTMDEGLSHAVQKVFISLYDEGLIYRGKRLVNWDPILHTAISDLEVENREVEGRMWHFKYPLEKGTTYEYIEKDEEGKITFQETRDYISIATTRPETMLGDGAIAVHPSDERYAPIVGLRCEIPVGPKNERRLIPIITDEYPDPNFGSGAVKITGAHDFNDYEVAKRNHIPMYRLMDESANLRADGEDYHQEVTKIAQFKDASTPPDPMEVDKINLVPDEYRGLSRYEARERIVNDIAAEGLMIMAEAHSMMQPYGDRSGEVIEPMLTDQWFVEAKTLAQPAIDAVKNGDLKFIPKNWENTYFEWMNNIQDWCISRQLWWGHRIPAWFDEEENIYVGESENHVREKYQLDDRPLSQDEDVLDTWFSSALWPFSTLGWPEKTPELNRFYPTSVLVTGFDIIFFWVARMIMMGLHFMDKIPFKEVYIHGLVRDQSGHKMSKSRGNVLDPIDLIDGIDLEALVKKRTSNLMQPQMAGAIEKDTRQHFPQGIRPFGTDALRFTFTSLAANGRDINFDTGRIEGYSNFCNKIWNAARFVFMNTEGKSIIKDDGNLSHIDHFILSRLDTTLKELRRHLEGYRFDLASQVIYDFIWHEFCDWYLELTKPILNGDYTEEEKAATRYNLLFVLEAILKALHPFMPYMTEEIWQKLTTIVPQFKKTISISTASFPEIEAYSQTLEEEIKWLKTVLLAIRQIRGEMNISPSRPLNIFYDKASQEDKERLHKNDIFLKRLGRINDLQKCPEEAPESAVAVVGTLRLLIPLADLIDKEEEIKRLNREIGKLEPQIKALSAKLANSGFLEKAPEKVVQGEQAKLSDYQHRLKELQQQLEKIRTL